MRRLVLACSLLLLAPACASASSVKVGSVRAVADAGAALLGNGRIARTWKTADGAVVTTSLRAPGREWSNGNSPDFQLDLNGVPTSSVSGWTLRSVTARKEPADPARPERTPGAQLVFDYGLDPLGLVTLERVFTLRPGASVIGVTSVLNNGSPAPLRVASYSLDQLSSAQKTTAHVLAYHGGSDWRDDYRVPAAHAGAFDDEGEVVRFDDG